MVLFAGNENSVAYVRGFEPFSRSTIYMSAHIHHFVGNPFA